jgi:hypothetical protein
MSVDVLIQQALQHGMDMARDPINAHITADDESRITTVYSPWLLQICLGCHHTFREGDLVRPDPRRPGRMLHEDSRYTLLCWSEAHQHSLPIVADYADPCPKEVREAFLRGLHEHWQQDDTTSELVEQGSSLIGLKCPVCRHTVRVGDLVVRCPCGNNCGGVFHQDVTRHLTCWDTWNRGRRRDYCAFTGAPYQTLTRSEQG